MSKPCITLAALKAMARKPAATTSPTAPVVALLRLVASAEVGDLVADVDDSSVSKAFAAFVSRLVCVRDGGAS